MEGNHNHSQLLTTVNSTIAIIAVTTLPNKEYGKAFQCAGPTRQPHNCATKLIFVSLKLKIPQT